MKTINVTFDDNEIEELQRLKGKMTWRQFILQFIGKEELFGDELEIKNEWSPIL